MRFTQTTSQQRIFRRETHIIILSDQINLEADIYTIEIWVDQVNRNPAGDDVTENDTLTKTIRIPVQKVHRKLFMEEFTSSTC